MPDTTTYGLPYPPATGVLPDVPYWLQRLADKLVEVLGVRLPGGLYMERVTINIPTSGAVGAGAQQAITFPAGRFSTAPFVVAAKSNLPSGSGTVSVGVTNITTSGCTAYAYNAATTPSAIALQVDVIAMRAPGS